MSPSLQSEQMKNESKKINKSYSFLYLLSDFDDGPSLSCIKSQAIFPYVCIAFGQPTDISRLQKIPYLIPDRNIDASCFICYFTRPNLMTIFCPVWFSWKKINNHLTPLHSRHKRCKMHCQYCDTLRRNSGNTTPIIDINNEACRYNHNARNRSRK